MIWALAYLYIAGALLSVSYSDAVGDGLHKTWGQVILIVAWPFVVVALWLSAVLDMLIEDMYK